MPDTDQQKKWLEAMRRRAEIMNDLYTRIDELSKQRNRKEIIRVAAEAMEVSPVENGNEVSIGSLEIVFNDDNEVVDIRNDDGTASFSVKPLSGESAV
jgi:hypothetical protein